MKLLVALAFVLAACSPGGAEGYDHDFVVPEGTGRKLDIGMSVEILPPVLEAQVGESLRIVNLDDRPHRIGPYYVGVGETLTHSFADPAEMSGPCTVRFDGEILVRVTG